MAQAISDTNIQNIAKSWTDNNAMQVSQRQTLAGGEGKKGGLTIFYPTDTLCTNGLYYGLTVDMICLDSGDD